MKEPKNIPLFSRALLPCVFTGIIATIVNGLYDILFRNLTGYTPGTEINFFSIPLATMITFIILGLIFFVCVKYFSTKAFTVTLIVLVIACIAITTFLHGNPNEPALYGNHGLIAGFILISGILALTLLPYFYNHPRKLI